MRRSLSFHREITDALRDGQAELAEALMRTHIRAAMAARARSKMSTATSQASSTLDSNLDTTQRRRSGQQHGQMPRPLTRGTRSSLK
ncbi:MAG: FCD domain-containing protein [Acidimicrobiales bacterium]